MRRFCKLSIVLVPALVLAACATGDEPPEASSPTASPPPPTATPSSASNGVDPDPASPTPTPPPSPTTTDEDPDPAAEVPAIADTCTLDVPAGGADTVRIAYPEGWLVQEGCEWFDPAAESVQEGTEPSVAVSWRVSDIPFERAADVDDEVADPIRYVGARSGYQALRVAGEATGQGIREEGAPVVTWLVDLDPGTDEQGGTLIGTAHTDGSVSSEVAAYALDRMADTLLVEPPASERFVVTRLEGGGVPVTVTWTADEGCFELRAGGPTGGIVDQECGPSSPGSSGLRLVLLEAQDGAQRMLAGITSSRIQRITVPAASTLSGATTQSTEGGHLFALPVREPPFEVTAHDYTGQVITTLSFDG